MAPLAALRPGRRQQAVAQVAVDGVVGRDDLGEDGGDDQDDEQYDDGNDGVAAQERPRSSEHPGSGKLCSGRGRGYGGHAQPLAPV